MGRASTASSYNLDALGTNPANIGKERSIDTNSVYFSIATNLGFMLDSRFAPLGYLDKYFTKNPDGSKKHLSSSDKNDIIDNIGNSPVNFLANVKPLSVVVKSKAGVFGFGIEDRIGGYLYLDKIFLDIALYGNERNRTYSFSNLDENGSWTRQFNISYARNFIIKNKNIKYINLGLSVKPQFGFQYSETVSNDLQITTNDTNQISGRGKMILLTSSNSKDKFELPLKPAGFGFGFDLGLATTLENFFNLGKLNLGLSITDIGYINWTENTNKYYYNGNFLITDITKKEQLDSLENVIKSTKEPAESFSRMLPTTIRIGAEYKFYSDKKYRNGKSYSKDMELMSIALDYIQGLSNNYGSTTTPIVALGFEYNPMNAISGRMGFAAGGREQFEMSLGLGINAGAFSMDIGTYNILGVFAPKKTKNISGGLKIAFKIR
jgi:hypothetical protein